jgi:hypothetical protein
MITKKILYGHSPIYDHLAVAITGVFAWIITIVSIAIMVGCGDEIEKDPVEPYQPTAEEKRRPTRAQCLDVCYDRYEWDPPTTMTCGDRQDCQQWCEIYCRELP